MTITDTLATILDHPSDFGPGGQVQRRQSGDLDYEPAAAEAHGIEHRVARGQGEADKLVSAKLAAPLCEGIASPDKTIRIWPGLFHEIFNEPERKEVLALTADWLEAHPAR